jgi:hypothetical protein
MCICIFASRMELVKIVGNDEVLAAFLLDQCVHTVGAAQFQP